MKYIDEVIEQILAESFSGESEEEFELRLRSDTWFDRISESEQFRRYADLRDRLIRSLATNEPELVAEIEENTTEGSAQNRAVASLFKQLDHIAKKKSQVEADSEAILEKMRESFVAGRAFPRQEYMMCDKNPFKSEGRTGFEGVSNLEGVLA